MNRSGRSRGEAEIIRIRILVLAMLTVFGGLALAMYRVQVAHGAVYQENLEQQSVRRVRLPGLRGRILDRHGAVLAENRPSYCVAIYLEELERTEPRRPIADHVDSVLATLSDMLGRPPMVDRSDVQNHLTKRRPLPLIAWRDLDHEAMARFAERTALMPGVDLVVEPVRVYPGGTVASHILGYVGRTNMVQDTEEPFNYYYPEMLGRSGIEKHMDETLRGTAGGRLMRVDVTGYRNEDLAVRDADPGRDIQLSIDVRIQRLAEEALQDVAGAAVVVDSRNGDVLALVSSPAFDPNAFVPYITASTWKSMVEDPDKPMVNRAVAGTYTPGSIFKPVVAFAALENRKIDPDKTFDCPGYFTLGNQRIACWYRYGHGAMNAHDAIQNSCNVYFCNVGLSMGHEYISHMARAMGLGVQTGIGLDYEKAGLVPDARWKRDERGEGWYEGDTCNFSIGQGPVTVTPLQMAMMTAAIANGGTVLKPRLVLGVREPDAPAFTRVPVEVTNELGWSRLPLRIVRQGMYDSVMSPRGTGRLAAVAGVEMAGKTGTAEFGPKALNKKRGWMIAFAPFGQPRYAVALVVDDADGGGLDAAPRLRHIMSGLFASPADREEAHRG